MVLSDLKTGSKARIVKVKGRGAFRKRILEMGFIRGQDIEAIRNAPMEDPIEYNLMGYNVSLRKTEAELIEISTDSNTNDTHYDGTLDTGRRESDKERGQVINIALVGNPNCGKTTLFNYVSGLNERVGNYSGVTVESKKGKYKLDGYKFNVFDLPGTYSISAYSPEELYVRKFIYGETPDIVINVIDSSNMERNLYLTTQLIDMDIKVIIALNMFDELEKKGDKFDYEILGKMIGIPIIPTISTKGVGVKELFRKTIEVYEDKDKTVRHIHINYGKTIEDSILILQNQIKKNYNITDRKSSRFLSIKLLEKDVAVKKTILEEAQNGNDIIQASENEINNLEKDLKNDSESLITDSKYGFIAGALRETLHPGEFQKRKYTEFIDAIVTNKVVGMPIFVLLMWLMFQFTFEVGAYPMDWIDGLVGILSDFVSNSMDDGMLKDLLVDGIIGGVGGVIIFLPNIVLLFLFISLFEDTGYMSRAVFVIDKAMHKIGLHGKSFIPMIMGFGCNVPAIMATRTIESRNDRMVTILINPFMSCGARLPVYVLFISAFFSENAGSVLFSVYFIGVAVAVFFAFIFKRTLFKGKDVPFVMELPPYRVPTFRSIIIHMWEKASQYLQKMGGVILVASILIWALGYFPRGEELNLKFDNEITAIENQFEISNSKVETSTSIENKREINKDKKVKKLLLLKNSKQQENSYLGSMGKFIEPVIKPLGFDWKMGVSIITGLAAKEIVVSTMGVLYHVEDDDSDASLVEKIKSHEYQDGDKKGEKVFTPLVAFSFMLFILLYVPCIAAVAAIKKETQSWKWTIFAASYSTAFAWIVSFLVYNIGMWF